MNYRRDFRTGLFDVLPAVGAPCAPLFASRLFVVDTLWNSFRSAEMTRSFGRNDIVVSF